MNRRNFIKYIGCGCGGFLLNSCGSAPITERKQLKLIPESKLNAQAAQIYEKVKEKEKLITDGSTLKEIKEIGSKMEDSISEYFYKQNLKDPTTNFQWEYILIDNKKIKNAWCMPGGKISQVNRTTGMDTVGLLAQLGLMNPFNRKQETEADYLGLIFSSLSGFDIRETTKIWERMREANKGQEPPEFMSTHPSSTNRINQINEWMNEIILKYPPIQIS